MSDNQELDELIQNLSEAAQGASVTVVEAFGAIGSTARAIRDDPFWNAFCVAAQETAVYRQYIEDEINLRLNGEGLGEPIGLLKADKLKGDDRE